MKMKCLAGVAALAIGIAVSAGAAEHAPAVTLFNGQDFAGWKTVGSRSNQWQFGQAALDPTNPAKLLKTGPGREWVSSDKNVNLATEAEFRDCRLELEFMLAKDSNSGVKLMNIYEIQLLDSFGKAVAGKEDCGAVYKESAPKVNACKRAGEWQTLVIDFRAPRFDAAGQKTANARFVKVVLNGQVVQANVEIAHGTNVSKDVKEKPAGPVYLQGDHGPVAFRNLKLTPLDD
jgi:hypothetical protein